MWFSLVAALITVGCVAASAWRLRFAVAPTALDAAILAASLRREVGKARFADFCKAVLLVAEAEWERGLVLALNQSADVRALLVNEQLTELDYTLARWSRVPRVCASIATSSAFLLATMALRAGLVDAGDVPAELRDAAMKAAVMDAVNVAAIGLAGAAFCIAIQMRARRAAKERAEAADKLVERLEVLAGNDGATSSRATSTE
jgi:hypothetical protein